jgi:hypothetical protein
MSPGRGKAQGEHPGLHPAGTNGRGYRSQQLTAVPSCVKNAASTPFTGLGFSVTRHAKLEAGLNQKQAPVG